MAEITLMDTWPVTDNSQKNDPENWYVEPFTKRKGCQTPGQCDDDCDCGCPYTVTDVEKLPLIETIARIFPNEWLAFIITPEEDDDYEPTHGKLIAHSPNPDEVYDAVNTVLWNQRVYVFFNGHFEALQASYGERWEQTNTTPPQEVISQQPLPAARPMPENLIALIYSAIDALHDSATIHEAIRRLRLARVQAVTSNQELIAVLDHALDKIETPTPQIDDVIWYLEDALAETNTL